MNNEIKEENPNAKEEDDKKDDSSKQEKQNNNKNKELLNSISIKNTSCTLSYFSLCVKTSAPINVASDKTNATNSMAIFVEVNPSNIRNVSPFLVFGIRFSLYPFPPRMSIFLATVSPLP